MTSKSRYQVCERVYAVGGDDITGGGDCCIYLVDCNPELLLIDAGVGRSTGRMMDLIGSLGFNPVSISTLILTHAHIDHIGGAKEVKDRTGCVIIVHRMDLDPIEKGGSVTGSDLYGVRYDPVKVDRVIEGRSETFRCGDLDLLCIHTPGHTPGSISLLIEVGGEKVLFGQDIHGPFFPEWGSDLSLWRSSMHRLLELEADILCEGHFGVYYGKEEVRRYIEGYLTCYS
jgi:glyoxylase-like metal-dependent hydrolase (beta-lactamase superfamily II)